MKRFIIFRNDRLGDFLILTNIIKKIKDKYKDAHITIVASSFNYKFIKNYKIIDKVYLYNRTDSFFYKISLIRDLFKYEYYASFSVDGKSFSNFCNFIIKSKFKLGLVYKFKFLNIWLTKPNFLYNYLIFDKYETFTSKKFLTKIEHLPKKLINLANFLNLKIKLNDNYYFEVSKKEQIKFSKSKYFKKKYILFHLDEKWTDIEQVNIKLSKGDADADGRLACRTQGVRISASFGLTVLQLLLLLLIIIIIVITLIHVALLVILMLITIISVIHTDNNDNTHNNHHTDNTK